MTGYRYWIALAAAMLCVCALPAVAEKITVDPNTVKAQEAEDQSEKTDTRLAQKVTYEARRKSVLVILTELSEQTKVQLKAGQNNKDWQVRDLKMNIFAKDVPLATLMNSMARTMKFKWSRDGKDGDYSYRLFADRKSVSEAERKRQEEERKQIEEQARKREKSFAKFAEIAQMKPEDVEKLRDQNPFLYIAAKSGLADSMGSFFAQLPAAAEALATGQEMSVNAAMLSPSAQQNLVRTMRDLHRMEGMFGGKREFPEDVVNNMGAVTIRVNAHMDMMKNRPEAGFMLGMVEINGGGAAFGLPLIDPDSNVAKLVGKLLTRAMEEGKSMEEIAREAQTDLGLAFMADMKKVDYGEKPVEHPDEPALKEKIKISAKSRGLDDMLVAVSEASKLTVVSDCYGQFNIGAMMGMMGAPTEQEAELKTILDKVSSDYGLNWDKQGSVVEFRHKDWYRRRALLIPEETLEGWRKTLKETGTLDIDDLARIAQLDMEQFQTNLMEDPVFSASGLHVIFPNREILRFYADLTSAQRSMLFGEGGLDLRSLTPEQFKQIEKLISARNGQFLLNADARVVIAGTRTPKEKRFEYKFTLTTTDDLKPIEQTLTTPEYKEPPKPQPKPAEEPKINEQPKTAEPPKPAPATAK